MLALKYNTVQQKILHESFCDSNIAVYKFVKSLATATAAAAITILYFVSVVAAVIIVVILLQNLAILHQ